MTQELALREILGHRSAVKDDEGAVASGALMVHRMSEHVFAGPGLPHERDRNVGRCEAGKKNRKPRAWQAIRPRAYRAVGWALHIPRGGRRAEFARAAIRVQAACARRRPASPFGLSRRGRSLGRVVGMVTSVLFGLIAVSMGSVPLLRG